MVRFKEVLRVHLQFSEAPHYQIRRLKLYISPKHWLSRKHAHFTRSTKQCLDAAPPPKSTCQPKEYERNANFSLQQQQIALSNGSRSLIIFPLSHPDERSSAEKPPVSDSSSAEKPRQSKTFRPKNAAPVVERLSKSATPYRRT